MTDGICIIDGCTRSVHIKKRGLCARCYGRLWRAGELGDMSLRHELTNRDYERARADCSVCGPNVLVKVFTSPASGLQAACKNGARANRRRMMYGVEMEQLEARIDAAGGCCEICRRRIHIAAPEGRLGPTLDTACLDHDHACCPGRFTCGECVRGVLCLTCNIRLGYWERGRALPIPAAAVAYLERTRGGGSQISTGGRVKKTVVK